MQLADITHYFPSGVAFGEAFINRDEERSSLKKNVLATRHILLMAPRRYGKTSLIHQVASEIEIPFSMVDLLAAYSDDSVLEMLYDKVGKLLIELLPPLQQAKEKVLQIFSSMKPELTVSAFGQKVVFHSPNNPSQSITDLLLKLDETAIHFKKKAILFIDEMQQLSFLKNSHSIEASIRHAVERSRNITYCFSGSSRHLLKKMFGDKERPLYRLCHTVEIGRIDSEHYQRYLQQCALKRWAKTLSDNAFCKIMQLTQEHPFYVNALCQSLWMEETIPDEAQVEHQWKGYIQSNRYIISDDIIELSLNQKKVLSTLAKNPTKELYSAEFLSHIKLTQSSVHKAVEALMEKDLIYCIEGYYRVLDPAIEYYIQNIA